MEKILKISGKDCRFRTSASIPRLYRLKFRRDIFNDLQSVQKQMEKKNNEFLPIEALTTFENIAYIMHKHGDPNQPNNVNDWLDQFETFDIYQVFPEIIAMWGIETETLVEAKKEDQK